MIKCFISDLKSGGLHVFNFFFLPLKILGRTSGLRTIDDLPPAHRDETAFRLFELSVYCLDTTAHICNA